MVFIVRRVSSLRILKMVAGMQCQCHQLLVGKKKNKLHFWSKVNKRLTSGQLMNFRFDRKSANGTVTVAVWSVAMSRFLYGTTWIFSECTTFSEWSYLHPVLLPLLYTYSFEYYFAMIVGRNFLCFRRIVKYLLSIFVLKFNGLKKVKQKFHFDNSLFM